MLLGRVSYKLFTGGQDALVHTEVHTDERVSE